MFCTFLHGITTNCFSDVEVLNSPEDPLGLKDFCGNCFGLVMDNGGGCTNVAQQVAQLVPYHIGPVWDDPHHWNRVTIRMANQFPLFKHVLDELSMLMSFMTTPRRCVYVCMCVYVCAFNTSNVL